MQDNPKHLKLLITIVDRGKGQIAVDLLLKRRVLFHRIVLGHGTARSEWLDLLGVGDPAKDIVFTVLPEVYTHEAMRALRRTLQFDNPGHGIAFSIPIGSVGGQRALAILVGDAPTERENDGKETFMEEHVSVPCDLIITIVNKGFADQVMDAARPAGAQGGTVVHARGAGVKEAEHFFGITIQPEKEMVLILTRHETKRAIMETICREVGLNTEGRGIVFSLPVSDVMGLARMMREEEEE